MRSARLLVVALCLAAAPSTSWAYAESGGVFDVGFAALPPTRPGGVVSLEYDSLDQGKDWSGARRASYAANPDKDIGTEFFTGAIRYMVDPSWGFEISAPVARRHLVTTDEHGVVGGADNGAIGDIRARGVYSGFSPGMSSGLTFGLKLPTGPFRTPDFARDSQIGAGGTDLLLGAYHKGRIATGGAWSWFSNGAWDEPLLDSGGYRPGAEIDAALGAAYDGWSVGGLRVAPFAQAVGTCAGAISARAPTRRTAAIGESCCRRDSRSRWARFERPATRIFPSISSSMETSSSRRSCIGSASDGRSEPVDGPASRVPSVVRAARSGGVFR